MVVELQKFPKLFSFKREIYMNPGSASSLLILKAENVVSKWS